MSDEERGLTEVKEQLEVGIVDDPDSFNVGVADELDGAILIVFTPKDLPKQALGFRGEAKEKFLLSMESLLNLFHGIEEVEEESPSWIVPEKKKPTLH